jgi:hypothetical protein
MMVVTMLWARLSLPRALIVRMNEMLGYTCGCVAVGGRITDYVVMCFLVVVFELIFTKYYVSMYCKGSM